MRIRAIAIGQIVPFLFKNESILSFMQENLENFSNLNKELINAFEEIGIPVQTKRFCSQPIFSYENKLFYEKNLKDTLVDIEDQLKFLQDMFKDYQFDYFACAMMLADKIQELGIFEKLLLDEVPQFIKNTDIFFTSLPVASTREGINISALKSGAKIIKQLSDPDPFKNLNFCVSANVGPNFPFFPAAYHFSDKPAFSLALEMADEVINAIEKSNSIKDAQFNLLSRFNQIYDDITKICEKISRSFNVEFKGIDYSPAPFPEIDKSIGTAIEKLGIEYFGAHGTLTGVALIKNAIPVNKEKVVGFSGFFQPVLEDYILSKRLSEGRFNLDSLLLYSTMCGAGLDVIPLPGDITEQELFYILLDMCTLSVRLNKPLTCRLMPIPGRSVGDTVEFDFEYFASSKIIDFRRLTGENKNDLFHRNEKFLKFL
ncbi:MAG: DUF711 family protein [Candidatus Lokiarchaeota archaeon]|nr:DUF711 family protein [Candidatus Lokiarchaeota archaeon]